MSAEKFKAYVLKMIGKIESGNPTLSFYQEKFKNITDKEIAELVTKLESGEFYLPYYRENLNDKEVDIEAWLAIAEEVGAEIFTKLWIEDAVTGEISLTPVEHWVALVPGRTQLQYLDDKMSVAADSTVRDALTGQVTGASKGSAISYPQLNTLDARGHFNNTMVEFLKLRGGDIEASRAYNRMLINTGGAKIEPIMELHSRPLSTETLSTQLTAAHLANNL